MSIELYVLFHGKTPSKAALQRRLKQLELPFSLKSTTGALARQSGYMPMTLRGEETGVEFDLSDDAETIEELAQKSNAPQLDRMASLRWSSDQLEMAAGYCIAASLAAITSGVVFDEQEGKFLSSEEAIEAAKRLCRSVVQEKPAKEPGTRPADIKRYLKPLLEERGDLVLVGRALLIRPVRHILRGAFLDRTGDRHSFQIWRYIKLLHENPQTLGHGGALLGRWQVFEPHFRPHLLDALATEIFDAVGPINSLGEFAHALEGDDRSICARAVALALAGQQERAIALLEEGERSTERFNGHWRGLLKNQRVWLNRDITLICAELHDREAAAAKELKLEKIWEPSLFPVECSDKGMQRCNEPVFTMDRWPRRPPDLISDPLLSSDDVQLGIDIVSRGGRMTILRPLSFDDAKRRHDGFEAYAIAARMKGDRFLFLRFWTGHSSHDPDRITRADYRPSWSVQFRLPTRLGILIVNFSESYPERGALELQSLSIPSDKGDIFYTFNNIRERSVSIHDNRSHERIYTERPMTDERLSICRFPFPPFGDCDTLLWRVAAYLPGVGLDPDLADREDNAGSWRSAGPAFVAFYSI